MPRLELLERNYAAPASRLGSDASLVDLVNMEDLAHEERLFDRMRSEIESHNGATRMAIDARVSSLSLELDRIHKLLQIRPTTSELQKVMLAVHENELKIQRVVQDMSTSVRSLVQDKVAEEMKSILENLKVTEAINEQGIKNVMRKVDGFANDVSNLKLGVENSLASVNVQVEKIRDMSIQTNEVISQFRAEVDSSNRRFQVAILENERHIKETSEELSESNLVTKEKFVNIAAKLEENEASMYQILRSAEERERGIKSMLDDLRQSLEEFKAVYHLDIDEIKSTASMLNDSLTSVRSRQEDSERYIRALKDVDVLNKVPLIEERLAGEEKKMVVVEKDLKSLIITSSKAGKSISELYEIIVNIPGKLDKEVLRVDEIERDLKDSKEFTKRLQTSLKETQTQLDELASVREELAVIKDVVTNQEQIGKSQQVRAIS